MAEHCSTQATDILRKASKRGGLCPLASPSSRVFPHCILLPTLHLLARLLLAPDFVKFSSTSNILQNYCRWVMQYGTCAAPSCVFIQPSSLIFFQISHIWLHLSFWAAAQWRYCSSAEKRIGDGQHFAVGGAGGTEWVERRMDYVLLLLWWFEWGLLDRQSVAGWVLDGVSMTQGECGQFYWFSSWWNISTMQHNARQWQFQPACLGLRRKWKRSYYWRSNVASDAWLYCKLLSLFFTPEKEQSQGQPCNNS